MTGRAEAGAEASLRHNYSPKPSRNPSMFALVLILFS